VTPAPRRRYLRILETNPITLRSFTDEAAATDLAGARNAAF
jgi:hypothetical protein